MDKNRDAQTAFESEASETSFMREFWEFLAHNKKFWMLPIIVALLLVGLLIFLTSAAALPFIYTLF
ncbi:MAG: hypothetical protein EHM61_09460 [Acidobacteria bacterium]|nr:MAG: hypothetical protein EHM61_09460 [Acidobacteriota bacterium]